MGNLFIGFPVPRAKIADMISGAAPPLIHHEDHEKDGDDEMDCTDLVGAGGGGELFRGIWLDDWDADATIWRKAYTGTAELGRSYETLSLKTNDDGDATGTIYRKTAQSIPTLTWANKRHFLFQCYLDCDSDSIPLMRFCTGNRASTRYFGFDIVAGALRGVNRGGGDSTEIEIKTFAGGFIGEDILLEAILFPGVKIEYWVNGVLEQTSSTNLPTGTTNANYMLYLQVDNDGNASNVEMDFNHIQVYQEG